MTATAAPAPRLVGGRVGVLDLGRIAGRGLGARRLRSGLTALGIAIGIAAMVAVLGDRRVESRDPAGRAGPDRFEPADGRTRPDDVRRGRHAAGRGRRDDRPDRPGRGRVGGVDRPMRRSGGPTAIPSGETGGIAVQGADPSLLETLEGGLAAGRFIDDAVGRYPTVVLGRWRRSASGSPRSRASRSSGSPIGGGPSSASSSRCRSRRRSTGRRSSGWRRPGSTWTPRPRRPRSMSARPTSCSTTSDPCCRRRPTPRARRRCT